MEISRRKALTLSAAALVAPRLALAAPQASVFGHGVASGDPDQNSVVLWTRAAPRQGTGPVEVDWSVYRDARMRKRIARGTVTTGAERDWTVKILAQGLQPGRSYYYRFASQGEQSVAGRTRTLPAAGIAHARIAFTACSNWPFGYFNAYRHVAQRHDLDLVLHLGDYIYEYDNAPYRNELRIGRKVVPDHEIVALADYRARYAQYRTDPDLAEMHRQHPFVGVWDDHETANNSWKHGAQNHDRAREGSWEARKTAAFQAWTEWMPVRDSVAQNGYIWRNFALGDLIDLTMLDTRIHGRDREAESPEDQRTINDPSRTLLGADQERWLFENLVASRQRGTAWRILGQQIMFGQLGGLPGVPILNPDQWDGYPHARQRVLDHLGSQGIDNVAVLTGDIHSSWGQDISTNPFDAATYNPDTGKGSQAVEFVATSVTSPGIAAGADADQRTARLNASHPHMKYVELTQKGYVLLDINRDRLQGEFWHMDSVMEPGAGQRLAATLATASGASHLEAASESEPGEMRDPAGA